MGSYRGGVVGTSQSKTWKRKWRMTTFTTEDRLKAEIYEAVEIAWKTDGNAKDAVINAIIKNVYEEHTAKVLKGQNPIQTRYGALYYETPYHGVSISKSCAYSCGCTHGKELESQYLSDHNEQPK